MSLALVVSVVVPVAVLAWGAWSYRWLSDDGAINLRVVQQIRAGHGAVFNTGERVEATTSPLWVGLLLLGSFVPGVALEWVAVGLGLLLSLLGLVLAELGAWRQLRQRGLRGPFLPAGALVVAALPPFWTYATAGLETGLSLAWIGGCFLALTTVLDRFRPIAPPASRRPGKTGLTAVLMSLGPLIRPDFVVFSVVFGAVLVARQPDRRRRRRLGTVGLLLVVPVAFEVFRMGYYASLVPNPALAKEAGSSRWGQGWLYLVDLVAPYWLWVPALLLGAALAVTVALTRRGTTRPAVDRNQRRDQLMVLGAPVLGGALSALYVVRVGGDFMHARLLLPALFAVLVPVSVVTVDRARVVLVTAVAAWAVVCATTLRPSYTATIGPHLIGDERGAWTRDVAGTPNPVRLRDFRLVATTVERDRGVVRTHGRVVILTAGATPLHPTPEAVLPLGRSIPAHLAIEAIPIGLISYGLGPDARIVDLAGLADPVGGRLLLGRRGRPGHEKHLGDAWVVARVVDPATPVPPNVAPSVAIDAARRAMTCGDLARVLHAVGDPLTPTRFLRNLGVALSTSATRVPTDPTAAARALCPSRR